MPRQTPSAGKRAFISHSVAFVGNAVPNAIGVRRSRVGCGAATGMPSQFAVPFGQDH